VVAEHVEDPIGRQRPRSFHENEHNAGGHARGRGPPVPRRLTSVRIGSFA
jgi:hypothetical protein